MQPMLYEHINLCTEIYTSLKFGLAFPNVETITPLPCTQWEMAGHSVSQQRGFNFLTLHVNII